MEIRKFEPKDGKFNVKIRDKELLHAYRGIAFDNPEEPVEFLDVRIYTGRARYASVIHCAVWLHGNNTWAQSSGSAGGGGYDKVSASFDEALRKMGIDVSGLSGVGETATRETIREIGARLGYKKIHISEAFA